MLLKQYYLGCLAHASYLIVDEATRTAVIVDPQRDIDQYLYDASAQDCHIRYVFLTHFHADFLAGHLELRDRVGAAICLGAQAQADYAFIPFKHGESLAFGTVRLDILETPGHTPESICLLVYDVQHDAQVPHAVLAGDTLFIGDVGRPDLMASIGMTAEDLAGQLYDSLHQKLLPLPDETLVYPAHGAGSMCGKNLSSETFSTLGNQRRFNYALQPMRKEEFVALVTADQPETPAYFLYDAMLNRRERATFLGADVLEGEMAYLRGDLDTAVRLMAPAVQRMHEMGGGSREQKDIFQDVFLELHRRLGQVDAVIELAQRRLQRNPNHLQSLAALAWAYHHTGQPARAQQTYADVVQRAEALATPDDLPALREARQALYATA